MITGLISAAVVTTAYTAFTEGVCIGMASYTIAKGIGKANFNFKK
jgi:hypothetical protein